MIDLNSVIIENSTEEQEEKNISTSNENEIKTETADNKDIVDNISEIPDEEVKEEGEVVDNNIITEIKNHFGYEVEGEFEENIEGLKKLTTEVAKKIALDEFNQVFSTYPDIAEYMQYRLNGGNPEKFFEYVKEPDFSNLELDDDEKQSKEIIRIFFEKQGFTSEEISDTLTDYEDTGILNKQAKKILPKLKELQIKERELLIKQQKAQREKEIEDAKNYWNSVKTIIESGKIKNISISESDKKKFFEWLALPKENGKSQRDIDRETLSQEDMLTLEYLFYKKLDISKLVVSKQNTQETERLKSLLKSKGNKLTEATSKVTSKNTFKLEDYLF